MERDSDNGIEMTDMTISTHTLTWSVTQIVGNTGQQCRISTHTLTWSVTGKTYAVCKQEIDFNSHAHVERDFCRFCYLLYLNYFNSHAHVERDIKIVATLQLFCNFNSHAHVERDF